MDQICPIEHCTGCMACYSICVHGAIVVGEDECGFTYPVIDHNKCVDCGLCYKICPQNSMLKGVEPLTAYAVYSNSVNDRESSTSGGASSVFAHKIIEEKGVVYGCAQNSYSDIRHIRITESDHLYKIKGSKYVQSDIAGVFPEVKKDLNEGKQVLFLGTPCQIAGLQAFLIKKYDNLISIDLVCHGVPSQKILKDHIQSLLKDQQKDCYVVFRKKGNDESDLKYGIFLSENILHSTIPKSFFFSKEYPYDSYIAGFMCGLFYRESCYHCKYANSNRIGDITIGDFWGLGVQIPSHIDKGKGISLVLCNTEKGEAFLQQCLDKLVYEKREVQEAILGNGQLCKPSSKDRNYNLFRELYPQVGYTRAVRRCLRDFYIHHYMIQLPKAKLRNIAFIRKFYKIVKALYRN